MVAQLWTACVWTYRRRNYRWLVSRWPSSLCQMLSVHKTWKLIWRRCIVTSHVNVCILPPNYDNLLKEKNKLPCPTTTVARLRLTSVCTSPHHQSKHLLTCPNPWATTLCGFWMCPFGQSRTQLCEDLPKNKLWPLEPLELKSRLALNMELG